MTDRDSDKTPIEVSDDGNISETVRGYDLELNDLLARIRRVDLAKHADALRPGFHPVASIPNVVSELKRGGSNVHIPISFSDGTKWLARIRQQSASKNPVAIRMKNEIMQSEIMTMRVLSAAGLKIPNAYLPTQVEEDIDFFFTDFVDGSPCEAPIGAGALNEQQQLNAVNSLASFFIELSSLSFAKVGSLMPDITGEPQVGPLVLLEFCDNDPPYFFGPFDSSAHRYLAQIEHVLSQIERGRSFATNAAEAYVTHLWLKDLVKSSRSLWEEGPTYMKHDHDKGSHLMVDSDGTLVGIIDWEWAHTASKSEAFAAPLGLLDLETFFEGSNELTRNEESLARAFDRLGRPDLADCVRGGKAHQRLHVVIGAEPDLVQLHALQHALTKEKGTETTFEEWAANMMDRYRDNPVLQTFRCR